LDQCQHVATGLIRNDHSAETVVEVLDKCNDDVGRYVWIRRGEVVLLDALSDDGG
jgi:hypothetical protein